MLTRQNSQVELKFSLKDLNQWMKLQNKNQAWGSTTLKKKVFEPQVVKLAQACNLASFQAIEFLRAGNPLGCDQIFYILQ